MKEFIEKLIGRLEENEYSHLLELNSEECLRCQEEIDDWNCFYRNCLICAFEKSKKIAKELAEEYINTSTNSSSGWIPCSERLPDKEGTYLVTLKKWEIIIFARFTDIKTNPHFNAPVIAWMPLPEPYTEEQK